MSRIYKEYFQLNNIKLNNLEKWANKWAKNTSKRRRTNCQWAHELLLKLGQQRNANYSHMTMSMDAKKNYSTNFKTINDKSP